MGRPPPSFFPLRLFKIPFEDPWVENGIRTVAPPIFVAMSRSKVPPVFRIFRGGDPKEFSYRPRYYDPDKERRQRVEEEARSDMASGRIDEEGLRDRMRASWRKREARGETMRSNLRFLIILILLCVLIWTLFQYLDRFQG